MTIPLKSNKILIHARQFIVFKCNVSRNGDMKQKQGSNYGALESVYLLNGLNNPLKLLHNRMQSDRFRFKNLNYFSRNRAKKRMGEDNS